MMDAVVHSNGHNYHLQRSSLRQWHDNYAKRGCSTSLSTKKKRVGLYTKNAKRGRFREREMKEDWKEETEFKKRF